MNKNRYYIRKKIRKAFHKQMGFDHETKFELRDLSLKQIRLAFSLDTEYMIIKTANEEFIISKRPKWRDHKTQYFDLHLVGERTITLVERKISLGVVMSFIELKDAKIYVRTAGGKSTSNEYSSEPTKEDFNDWCIKTLTAGSTLLKRKLKDKIEDLVRNFTFDRDDSWEVLKDLVNCYTERMELDICEIVRLYNGDNNPPYYSRYSWTNVLWEWQYQLGEEEAKKKFWKACISYVS